MEATCTRDHLIYASECLRDDLGVVMDNLADVIKRPTFRSWELREAAGRVKLDLAMAATQPQIGVLDEIHQVAFRKNLGNSIYCMPHRIAGITADSLFAFTQEFYAGKRAAVVGVGVEHSRLVEMAQNTFSSLPDGTAVHKEPAKYVGGESLRHLDSHLVHAAVVSEGASLGSKDMITLGVLQRILGVTPFIKWGSNNVSSRLNKAAAATTDGPFAASTINASYSDSGLFGCYVVAEPSEISKVMKAVVAQVGLAAKGDFSDQDLARAKNQFKANVLMTSESRESLFEDIGTQVLLKGSYVTPEEASNHVDSVTKTDIVTVAKRVFGSKASLSAAGDVTSVPHLDELFSP